MKTGMVIIHYNDLESVNSLIKNVKDYEILDKIIIVDNCSRSNVKVNLRRLASKKIEIIENSKNVGFAAAINIGSRHLIKELGLCNIIISNTDIIINREADIQKLVSVLSQSDIGVVAPVIVENGTLNRGWKNASPFLDSILNLVVIHRYFRKKYIFYDNSHYQGSTSIVDVASGCFFLITSVNLEKIGFLDENTFLYYEENILAKKLKKYNLKEIICNNVLVIHNHSVSIDKNMKKIRKLKLQKQSQYYFHKVYNNANLLERILLKSTAFFSRILLAYAYFILNILKKIIKLVNGG